MQTANIAYYKLYETIRGIRILVGTCKDSVEADNYCLHNWRAISVPVFINAPVQQATGA